MQLAFSTNAYLNHSFADAVTRLAKIGYRGVEIMADVPHAWPAYLLPEQKQAIRDALARNALAISNINAFMMHAVNDHLQQRPACQRRSVEVVERDSAAVDEQAAESFTAKRLDRFGNRAGAAVIRAGASSGWRTGGCFACALAVLIDDLAQLVDLGGVAAERSGFENRQIESEQQARTRREPK